MCQHSLYQFPELMGICPSCLVVFPGRRRPSPPSDLLCGLHGGSKQQPRRDLMPLCSVCPNAELRVVLWKVRCRIPEGAALAWTALGQRDDRVGRPNEAASRDRKAGLDDAVIAARLIPLFHLFGVCLSSVRHLLSLSLRNVVMQPVPKPQWHDQTNSVQLLMNADKATDAADGGGGG